MSKLAAFFASDKGHMTTGVLAILATTSATLVPYLPNTLFLDKTKEFLQLFSDGFPVPVPHEMIEKVNQVKSDLKLEQDISSRIPAESSFTVFGFDIIHIGTAKFRTGAIIGIPANYNYKSSITPADKRNIVVGQKSVHWTTPEGIALESSLLLSDSAQKYAIAREMCKANTQHVALQTFVNMASCYACYYVAYKFNRRANMFARPFQLRATLYTLLGGIMFTTWMFIKDFTTYRWEEDADEAAAGISEEYAKGALEFYSKILQRNLAMRSLLGDEGPKLYTSLGNDRETFRTKHVPFVTLRDRAARRCESFKKPEEPEPVKDS